MVRFAEKNTNEVEVLDLTIIKRQKTNDFYQLNDILHNEITRKFKYSHELKKVYQGVLKEYLNPKGLKKFLPKIFR